jgi:putative hemolysin
MLSVEKLIRERFPAFAAKPALVRQPVVKALQWILREKQVNDFVRFIDGRRGLAYNDGIVEYFQLGYRTYGCEQIPASGPLVIVANHPLGALDGAALIQTVSRVRGDVRMVVSDILLQFSPAREILLPVDNLSGRCNRGNVSEIDAALARGEAVIFFPAGEVSRLSPNGLRDSEWRKGFLRAAAKAQAPILPAHIGGRNSLLFYSLSMLYKPLAMLLLAREIFANHALQFDIHLGRLHNWQEVEALGGQQQAAAHLRQQVYQLKPSRQPGRLRQPFTVRARRR